MHHSRDGLDQRREQRHKDKKPLCVLLIAKLHRRYKFPDTYDNEDLKGNLVNDAALGKFSRALSAWRTRVRKMLDAGKGFDEIYEIYLMIQADDLALFKDKEELTSTKALREWGRDTRKKNIGNHHLGSRGYAEKQLKWDKEDEALRAEGKQNTFNWFANPLACRFIRARYHEDKGTRELVTAPEVKDLEKFLVRNLPS
jgi:hypothetical protein